MKVRRVHVLAAGALCGAGLTAVFAFTGGGIPASSSASPTEPHAAAIPFANTTIAPPPAPTPSTSAFPGSASTTTPPNGGAPSTTSPTPAVLAIAVQGNHLIDYQGQTVVLRGADTTGTQFSCLGGKTVFDGSEASSASIAAMRSWHFNAARVQLNESCWLGIQGVKGAVSGKKYQAAVEHYVEQLNAAGMYVIVDLNYSSTGGSQKATGEQPMPDLADAPAFWKSVAAAFRYDPAVIFDLFDAPYPDHDTDTAAAWKCDISGTAGGGCSGLSYKAAGMQQLLDAVRSQGATNVVMIPGPQHAGDLDQWLAHEPRDAIHELAASIHIYWDSTKQPDATPCSASSCWTRTLAPLANKVPVVVGAFGELDCGDRLYAPFLSFADQHDISYLAWAWFTGNCATQPSLIKSYNGSPTSYGTGYKQHLASVASPSLR